MNGVSDKTVKAIVLDNPETSRISEQKKKENTLDMLAYMDSRKDKAQKVIDDYLNALSSKEKIKNAKLSEIATALGIVVDKFTKNAAGADKGENITIVNNIPKQNTSD